MLRMTQDIRKEPSILGGLIYQAVCFYRLLRYRNPVDGGTMIETAKLILKGKVRRHWLLR